MAGQHVPLTEEVRDEYAEILEPAPRPRPEEVVGLLLVALLIAGLWGFYV